VGAYQGWLICLRWLADVLILASLPLAAGAQPATGKVPRIGILGVTFAAGCARQVEAVREGFRDLGYVEGQNIEIRVDPHLWRRAPYFVDRILKGGKPATIPVEQTAKSLGAPIQQSLLLRADRVIE
jgi:hypothetical protein